ncbi:MAG: sporulation integral membrane protein YlbJ [Bacillota bacterium]
MQLRTTTGKRIFLPLFKAFAATVIALSMVAFPQQTFQAAFRGLDAWWSIVFPALLPFFVMSELLIGLGVVNFMGVLLEPVMRPLFNVPGAGAFVVVMGYSSGAPIGTMLTVNLRKKNLCSRTEAQRLMSFTNNSSPLFLFGAVSVGMFHNVSLGLTLALSHYLANISIGLLLGRISRKDSAGMRTIQQRNGNLIIEACRELIRHQEKEKRPLGALMADAVLKSAQTLSMIGGYIIFFSVLTQILDLLKILDILAGALLLPFSSLGLAPEIGDAVATGFFEITLGTKLCSEVSTSLPIQLLAASAIMGWGGLSIHAQVASLLKGTDIKIHTFLLARCLHAALAPLITLILIGSATPVFNTIADYYQPAIGTKTMFISNFIVNLLTALSAMVIILIIVAIVFACFYLIRYLLKR